MIIKSQKGFTLIELLVVVSIISMLTSIVISSTNTARMKARDARRISDIKQLQIALELYFNGYGSYPATLLNGQLSALNVLAPSFIPSVPNDPLNTIPTPSWSWTNQNTYYYWGPGSVGACGPYSYTLWYRLEGNSNGNAFSCVKLDNNSFTLNL